MGFVWNPFAVPGFLAMLLAFAMAAFVYFAAPGGQSANRRLSFILLLEGCAVGAGNAIIYVVDQANFARAAQAVSITAVLLLPAAYLYFIATVDSPLGRFWNHQYSQALLFVVAAISVGVFFVRPREFLLGVDGPYWYADFDADLGPAYIAFGWFRLAILLYCFVVAIHAYQRATTKLGKARAKAFAIAFGIWDAVRLVSTFLFIVVVPRLAGNPNVIATLGNPLDLVGVWLYPVTIFLFAPLLAYGVLRTQLLDIQIKLRFTINKGALGASSLLVFFIVAQMIESFLGNSLGILGGALAGGLFFLLSPVQKAAERLAQRATPGARPVGDMTAKERVQLYQEQLEFAFADGNVSKKERMLLEHLRNRLGVQRDQAQRLERQFLASFGAVGRRATGA